ncbi:MAG: hypothetical protein OFPII_06440 [Osedax symbiont Rs1]|nr:MAG: hypothetical protein OFPII_06440 [Osedax symbiont Rs1]
METLASWSLGPLTAAKRSNRQLLINNRTVRGAGRLAVQILTRCSP